MNLPNVITLLRVPILFIIVGSFYLPPWWGLATAVEILYIIASFMDMLDGYLARRSGCESNFGKLMDALVDKIFTVGLFVTLWGWRIIPDELGIFVILILCREFLVSGLRMMAAHQGTVLAAERIGKLKTFFQLVSIGFLIGGRMLLIDWGFKSNSPPYQWVHSIGITTFILAAIITVTSGFSYLVKYWVIFKKEQEAHL